MTKQPHILCIGGGSMGHVFPSFAVAQAIKLHRPDVQISFIISPRDQEKVITENAGFHTKIIHAPKFPRGFTLRLFIFPFLFLIGLLESLFILFREKPSVIFSKGGFVSVPICIVAWFFSVPIILHESDSVMGIGNSFISRMAKSVCTGFPMTLPHISVVHTGNPVRAFIKDGLRLEGLRMTGFSGQRPIVLITGGSQGAHALNQAVASQIQSLLAIADVIHLTGEGKKGAVVTNPHYVVRPFVTMELPHLYACADLVVTRAGAGTIAELAVLTKPALVIPLEGVAHDHQLKNAHILEKARAAWVLRQSEISTLTEQIKNILSDAATCHQHGKQLGEMFPADASERVAKVVLDAMPACG